jgi:hypothetical protein
MAFKLNDRVKESSATTGTGTFTLGGAVSGFESFSAGIGGSNTTYYCIFETGTNNFEVGFGTLNSGASTLARTYVISSSNSDAKVNFAGATEVFCTVPGAKIGLPTPEEYGSSSAPKVITVTVADKSGLHPYQSAGGASTLAYYFDGLESPAITLSGADKSTAYTTNVTTNGTPGSSGAYTQIAVDANTPNILYYQCSSHAYMGNFVNVVSNRVNGDLTVGSKLKMPTNTANKILVADGTSFEEVDISGDATIASGGALTLADSGVTAASYTNSSITVDAKGRVTAASSGSAGISAGFAVAMAIAL